MLNVRKFLNSNKLLLWLLANKPDSPFLTYSREGSDTYTTITKWCKIPEGMAKPHWKWADEKLSDAVLSTKNEIFYSEKEKAFVDLSDEFYNTALFIDLSSILPIELFENEDDPPHVDAELYPENTFTKEEWGKLEILGAFTKVFQINKMLIE